MAAGLLIGTPFLDNGNDTIHDFELDLDLIGFFNGTVSQDLSELAFETVDGDGGMSYGADSITILGIDGATLEDQANVVPG